MQVLETVVGRGRNVGAWTGEREREREREREFY